MNNKKSNLRRCNQSQNCMNRQKASKLYRYKGISFRKEKKYTKPYRAHIRVGGVLKYLGSYHTDEEAARAYDRAAIEHFGEFACTNFPKEEYGS